jgi:hypothetical protein
MDSFSRSVLLGSLRCAAMSILIAGPFAFIRSEAQSKKQEHKVVETRESQENGNPQYRVIKRLQVGNCGYNYGDLLAIDEVNRHLFGACDRVINIDDFSFSGELPSTSGHAYVLAPGLGRGLTRHGLIFDLKSLREIGAVSIPETDEMAFDSGRGLAFALGDPTSVVDIARAAVTGRVSLGGHPEAGVADDRGHLYVNLPNAIAVIDTRTLRVESRWPLKGCGGALSLDTTHRRLFASCGRQVFVVDADNGRLVATVPTPGQADQSAFDANSQLFFSPSQGDDDGKVTIIHEDSPDRYSVVQIVQVGKCHGSLTIDARTHRVFLYSLDPFTVIVLSPGIGEGAKAERAVPDPFDAIQWKSKTLGRSVDVERRSGD